MSSSSCQIWATKDVAEAVKEMRGEPLELFRQTEAGRSRQIRLAAEVAVDPVARPGQRGARHPHPDARYEVTLEWREPRPNFIQVAHEAVYPLAKKKDEWAKRLSPSQSFKTAYLKYD